MIASIIPTVAVSRAGANLGSFEGSGVGINFDNAMISYQNYKFGYCLLMNIAFGIVFTFLGLYLDKVIPSGVGTKEKWYFLCTKKFWRGHARNN